MNPGVRQPNARNGASALGEPVSLQHTLRCSISPFVQTHRARLRLTAPYSGRPRSGLTLYEVVLSLAILLGSMAVLGQLIATGSRAATQSKLRTEAMLHCQTQMAEVIASSTPPAPVDGALLEEDAAGTWVWSFGYAGGQTSPANQAATAASPHSDLLLLEVSVSRINLDNTVEATATLKRYVRNPQLYVEAADRAARLAAEAAE